MAGDGGPETVREALLILQRAIDTRMVHGKLRDRFYGAGIANASIDFSSLLISGNEQQRRANEPLVEPALRLRAVHSLIGALNQELPEAACWYVYYHSVALAMLLLCALSTDPLIGGVVTKPTLGMEKVWHMHCPTLPGLGALGGELLGAITHACEMVKQRMARWEARADYFTMCGHGSSEDMWTARLTSAFVLATLQAWLQGTPAWDAADSPEAERGRLLHLVRTFTDAMAHSLEGFVSADMREHFHFLTTQTTRAAAMPCRLQLIGRDRQPAAMHALLDSCTDLLRQAVRVCKAAEAEDFYGDAWQAPGDEEAPVPTTATAIFGFTLCSIARAITLAAPVRPSPRPASLERCLEAADTLANSAYELWTGGKDDPREALRGAARVLRTALAHPQGAEVAPALPTAAPLQPPPPQGAEVAAPPQAVDPEEARAKAAKKAAKKERQRARRAAGSHGPVVEDTARREGTSPAAALQDAAAGDSAQQAQPAKAQPAAQGPGELQATAAQPGNVALTAQPAAEQPAAAERAAGAQPAGEPALGEEAAAARAGQQQPAGVELAGVSATQEGADEAQAAADPAAHAAAAEDLGPGRQLATLRVAGQPAAEEQEAAAKLAERPAAEGGAAEARPAATPAAEERPSSSGQRAPAAAREPRPCSSAGAACAPAAGQGGGSSLDLPPGLTARRGQLAAPRLGSSEQRRKPAAAARGGGRAAGGMAWPAPADGRLPAAPPRGAAPPRPRPRPPGQEQREQACAGDGSRAAPQPASAAAGSAAAPGGAAAEAWLEELCTCPITQELFADPVIATDGITYERAAIEEWVRRRGTSPMTQAPLALAGLQPNLIVRQLLQERSRGA